jgi:adenine-specific DNA-methyltransferase
MSRNRKQKLELTWIGKGNRHKLEPRILLEDDEKSYHARQRVADHDIFDNRLIFGDNLLALKALEQEFAGKIKCIFIDPPYNTGAAFEQYDDGVEHSLWLALMCSRLEILKRLLREDGSLWITIDDNECHYLKVLCDEIFGRSNFVTSIAWEKDKGRRGDTDISSSHDHILLYVSNHKVWRKTRNLLPRTPEQERRYRNPDNDPRGPWLQGDNRTAKSGTERARFEITLPSGRRVTPPPGRYWVFSKESFEKARVEGRVYFGSDGNGLPIIKRYLSEVQAGVVLRT